MVLLILGLTPVVVVAEPARAAPVDCSRGVNLGFETPLVRDNPMGPAPNWALFDETLVPGWATSASDDLIEFWESGFLGVPAYAGNQLAEMNATQPSTLSQDIDTLEGDSIDWFVAHRARTDPTDSADLRFGAPGAPVDTQLMVSPTGSWTTYSGTYVVPAGQTTTRMSFVSNNSGSLGNFLDGIMLELECEITLSSAFTGFTDIDISGHVNPGDTAGFTYLVSNVGSATVENLTVDDTLGLSASCPATTLTPGASTTCTATYVLTAADVDGGSVDSDATATASDAAGIAVSDSDTISEPIPPEPSISINKTAGLDDTVVLPAGRVDVGDVISYSFDVTNTGNVTLDPVSVDDPTTGGVTCPGTSLASGEMMTCNASLLLDQVDIDSGSVANTATATGIFGAADVTDQGSANVTLTATPALGLAKASTTDPTVVGAPGRLDAGDRIDYTITVTNQGNVTLDPVAVADPTVGALLCTGSSLAPGDSLDCTGSVTLGQGDIDTGAVSNTANALGTPPSGPDISASDSISTDIPPLPSLGIAKSLIGYQQQIDGAVVVTFEYTLTNYGNVTISDLGVNDDVVDLFSGISPTGFVTIDGSLSGSPTWDGTGTSNLLAAGQQLAPGETGNVSAQFNITASVTTTIGNTSSASGTAPDATLVR
ncbi:MAG: hypothetical protein WBM90_14715, partial [Acidimicrobiia bacterium]